MKGIPNMKEEALKGLNKDKKLVKKLEQKYNAFLASDTVPRQLQRLIGPDLNATGKFSSLFANGDEMAKINELK